MYLQQSVGKKIQTQKRDRFSLTDKWNIYYIIILIAEIIFSQ